jgi:hypothetical protein
MKHPQSEQPYVSIHASADPSFIGWCVCASDRKSVWYASLRRARTAAKRLAKSRKVQVREQ